MQVTCKHYTILYALEHPTTWVSWGFLELMPLGQLSSIVFTQVPWRYIFLTIKHEESKEPLDHLITPPHL